MQSRKTSARTLLSIGFGGLLALLAFAGVYGFTSLRAIASRNGQIRTDYLTRDRILQQLRSDLYQSGTHIRDLILEADPTLAAADRREYERTHLRIEANCQTYGRILLPEERRPFAQFTLELNRYFDSLNPALQWNAAERRTLGYSFMKQSLLPGRMLVVELADQLSGLNQRQLESGYQQVSQLFRTFQLYLILFTLISLAIGVALAAFSTRRLLRLERLSRNQLAELSSLSSRLVQVQESERRAIARELHDEVGQAVSGLLLGIGNVAATLSSEQNTTALDHLADLRRLAEHTVSVVRNLSLLLRPSMLDDLGLIPALQWQAREIARTANIAVHVSADSVSEQQVSEDVKTCIYRVVQEALNNVIRHARATAVQVHLTSTRNEGIALSISDNGRGFVPAREKGLGILGMEERVRHLNGQLSIQSEPGHGATLVVRLPPQP